MADIVRKFATRVLLLHLLAFLVVLALVLGAAVQLYRDARRQILQQAVARQELLAGQTSRAIAEFFDGILDNLDLLQRSEGAVPAGPRERFGGDRVTEAFRRSLLRQSARSEDATNPTNPQRYGPLRGSPPQPAPQAPETPTIPPIPVPPVGPVPLPNPIANRSTVNFQQALWRQLENRATHLLVIDPASGTGQELGSAEGAIPLAEVLTAIRPYLSTLDRARVTPAVTVRDQTFVVVCAPVNNPQGQRRVLAAVVPLPEVSTRFLDELTGTRNLYYAIYDDTGRILATSDPSVPKVDRSTFTRRTPDHYIPLRTPTTSESPSAPAPGLTPAIATFVMEEGIRPPSGVGIVPSIVAISDVDVEGPNWQLVVASPLAVVDDLLAGLFGKTLLWGTFLLLATAGLLISTSTRLIQTRLRLERERTAALSRELDRARAIQLDWLPQKFDKTPQLDLSGTNVPASLVSGDFYNWFELPTSNAHPNPRTVVVIGDVTGHGLSAALMMSTVQLLVRSWMARSHDPGQALQSVNSTLCLHDFSGQFVTLLVLVIEPATGKLELATAGHPAPVVITRDPGQPAAHPQPLKVEPALMLGVDPDEPYATQRYNLPAECTLVLYTDGLTEAANPKGEQLQLRGLLRELSRLPERATPSQINSALVARVEAHQTSKELVDDLTLVTVQYGRNGSSNHG
jgi:serine phosphatase RsbU (regulator of sigma subunit)